jgi:coenzyme F420-reducing hydrogenase alpha subunit
MIVGDIDIQKANANGLTRTYRICYIDSSYNLNRNPIRNLSFSYAMFLAFIVDLFSDFSSSVKILMQLVNLGGVRHVLSPLIHYNELYMRGINVFDYNNYIEYIVDVYIEYYGNKKFERMYDENGELVLLEVMTIALLNTSSKFIIPTVEENIKQYIDSKKNKLNKKVLKRLFEMVDEWCKLHLKRRGTSLTEKKI